MDETAAYEQAVEVMTGNALRHDAQEGMKAKGGSIAAKRNLAAEIGSAAQLRSAAPGQLAGRTQSRPHPYAESPHSQRAIEAWHSMCLLFPSQKVFNEGETDVEEA